jgi:hypothetical protein
LTARLAWDTEQVFMTTPTNGILDPDLLPPELRAVVELFATELATVKFPDVDTAALGREVDVVRARAAEAQRAREALAVAESALAQRIAVLAQLAARGLAYARIYAEAHPDRDALARTLAAIVAPAERAVAPPPRRRGRPPKVPRTELPFERPPGAVSDGGAASPRGAAQAAADPGVTG